MILQVPPAYFFEGMPGVVTQGPLQYDFTQAFLADRHGLALARAFMEIGSPAVRASLVAMAEALTTKDVTKSAA